jgi:hypothetical protein
MRARPLQASRLLHDAKVRTLDDRIAGMIREAEQSGELRTAKSWGKPLDFGDGYEETPADLRIAYKVLKDAGCAPAEVQLLNDVAALRRDLKALPAESPEAQRVRTKIVELEATIGLRLDRIARNRSL